MGEGGGRTSGGALGGEDEFFYKNKGRESGPLQCEQHFNTKSSLVPAFIIKFIHMTVKTCLKSIATFRYNLVSHPWSPRTNNLFLLQARIPLFYLFVTW